MAIRDERQRGPRLLAEKENTNCTSVKAKTNICLQKEEETDISGSKIGQDHEKNPFTLLLRRRRCFVAVYFFFFFSSFRLPPPFVVNGLRSIAAAKEREEGE